jgi:putative AdoMet-dependent methyltransferase
MLRRFDTFPLSDFDNWSETYDQSVYDSQTFPFVGYSEILDSIVRSSEPKAGLSVLDLGTGTGNLARLFSTMGCKLWCTDFSFAMLEKAKLKLPNAYFFRHDLRSKWPQGLERSFDRIVSAYVFHHFTLNEKISILTPLVAQRLAPGGWIVIGDIAFPNQVALEKVKAEVGNDWEEEYYWLADKSLFAMEKAGLKAEYSQISPCAGVFIIRGS